METIPATRNILSRHDVVIGMLIAAVMGTAFTLLSSGLSLIVTFVPGIVVTALTFAWLYFKQRPLPDGAQFIPVFITLLAVQFLHFAEEYLTGFHTRFPVLYGGTPYSPDLFVAFNMAAYFVFTVTCLLAFLKRRWFLLMPALFFIIYGAIGNAISHSWWSLSERSYFPGLVTAQAYWVLGPMVLYKLLGRRVEVAAIVALFGVILISLLTIYATPAAVPSF